ncbi:DNA binding [Striga asiatica]|uniref:DNA binding n=1 Tax=Striga asiatica TaxID=4170 RepID=A0A5A7QBZ5_STRAF|nr:DNA binding [Striga asiatica]
MSPISVSELINIQIQTDHWRNLPANDRAVTDGEQQKKRHPNHAEYPYRSNGAHSEVEPEPRLAAAAPVQQAHWTRVEVPAAPPHVVPAQPVLVPPVLDRRHASGEHQQERRQRAEFVDPARTRLLRLHPRLYAARVPQPPPFPQIYHHHPRVKVARPPAGEHAGESRVRPEMLGEILREICVAVLGRADCFLPQARPPQLRNVVDDDQI